MNKTLSRSWVVNAVKIGVLGREPPSADEIFEIVLRQRMSDPHAVEWTLRDISHALQSACKAGEIRRVGRRHCQRSGREIPLYGTTGKGIDYTADEKRNALATVASISRPDLAAVLLSIRDGIT